MKSLKKLKGAKLLSKIEQRSIKGGLTYCRDNRPCPEGYICDMDAYPTYGVCVPYMEP